MFVYELSGCGLESSCCHLNFRFRACFEQGVHWHSWNCRVCTHSETRTWHDKNIQSFFSIWVFFHEQSRFTGYQGKGDAIPLTLSYHFHPVHRYLDINWTITEESSPQHITSSGIRTGSLCFRGQVSNH